MIYVLQNIVIGFATPFWEVMAGYVSIVCICLHIAVNFLVLAGEVGIGVLKMLAGLCAKKKTA